MADLAKIKCECCEGSGVANTLVGARSCPWCGGTGVDPRQPSTEEVRIVDPQSGGEKGMKKARFSLIPFDWLWALAEHYGVGATKYADRNWEKGYKWSLSLDAHSRHLNQWLMGEDNDPETGSSHLIAAAWHLVALWWFHKHSKGTDDITPRAQQYVGQTLWYDPNTGQTGQIGPTPSGTGGVVGLGTIGQLFGGWQR